MKTTARLLSRIIVATVLLGGGLDNFAEGEERPVVPGGVYDKPLLAGT